MLSLATQRKSAQNNSLLKWRILWQHLNQAHLCILKQFALGLVRCPACPHCPNGASAGLLCNGTSTPCQNGAITHMPFFLAKSPNSNGSGLLKGALQGEALRVPSTLECKSKSHGKGKMWTTPSWSFKGTPSTDCHLIIMF